MEDYLKIRALLDAYWEGQTSVEEEQRLKAFFNHSPVDLPADLQQTAALFRFFGKQAELSDEAVDFPDKAALYQPPAKRFFRNQPARLIRLIGHYWEYAAMAVLIVGSAWWFQVGGNAARTAQLPPDTYQNPEEAFAVIQKALQLIATNLSELPTHAKGDGLGFGFHRVCFVTKV